MLNLQPSDKSETNKSAHEEGEQSPNEKFKSLLKHVTSLTREEVEQVKREIPVLVRKKHSN